MQEHRLWIERSLALFNWLLDRFTTDDDVILSFVSKNKMEIAVTDSLSFFQLSSETRHTGCRHQKISLNGSLMTNDAILRNAGK